MKRWLAATILVLACAHSARAQKYSGDVVVGIQPGVGIAVASYSNDYTISIPFMLQMDFAVTDGTAIGFRGGYQMFNTDDNSSRNNMKIAQLGVQAKRFFTPESRAGMYGVVGWAVHWYKEDRPKTLSDPAWGGLGGLGIHYEATDEVSFYVESVFNLVFARPEKLRYFDLAIGVNISIKAE